MDYKLEVLWTINLMSWSINSKSYGLLTHSTIQTFHFVNPKSVNERTNQLILWIQRMKMSVLIMTMTIISNLVLAIWLCTYVIVLDTFWFSTMAEDLHSRVFLDLKIRVWIYYNYKCYFNKFKMKVGVKV